MKGQLIAIDGKKHGEIELPPAFDTPYRPEVIHKVYVNVTSHSFQRQGRYPAAGEMVSAESRNTGLGIARLARARGEGFTRAGQAASVAGVRHGRVAHPPESWKITYKKINKRENRLGLCSAIAATANRELVVSRGHKIADTVNFPIITTNEVESIAKTKDLKKFLVTIGLESDLERTVSNRKSRSGTGRRRGRPARMGVGALIIVGKDSKIISLTKSLPGVEIKSFDEISVVDLAPGSKPIRLTIFSQNSINAMKDLKVTAHKVLEAIKGVTS